MVASLLPMLQHPGVRTRALLLPMHFTAISVWADGMRLLPRVRKEERLSFYNGIGCGILLSATVASVVGYYLAGRLPLLLAAGLLFLTPMSLLMSVCSNARTLLDALALVFGLVLGPAIAAQKIGLDLLWTGLIGGSLAYGIHRLRGTRPGGLP